MGRPALPFADKSLQLAFIRTGQTPSDARRPGRGVHATDGGIEIIRSDTVRDEERHGSKAT
jgi:hypothetical protein